MRHSALHAVDSSSAPALFEECVAHARDVRPGLPAGAMPPDELDAARDG